MGGQCRIEIATAAVANVVPEGIPLALAFTVIRKLAVAALI